MTQRKAFLRVTVVLFLGFLFPSSRGSAQTVNDTAQNEKYGIWNPTLAQTGLKHIYSNLADKGDLYNYSIEEGPFVAGPNSAAGQSFRALPFTPKQDSHVSQVQVALQYDDSGANQVNLSIYGDSGGVPGTLLAGPATVTNLIEYTGTCCSLTIANFSPVAVTGGTQYWVVADTPLTGTGSDFVGVWLSVAAPNKPLGSNCEGCNGGSWYTLNADILPASEVRGTIP